MQIETSSRAFSDSAVYCYNNSLGLPGPREAIAYFLGKWGWSYGEYYLTVLYQQIVDVVHLMYPVVEHKITTAKHFMYPEQKDLSFRDALNIIRLEHVAFGSGAASLLSNLALSLAEEGDAVLIPAPVSCM